jgi:hypothetical protein
VSKKNRKQAGWGEVATAADSVANMSRTYRAYTATLLGDYLDIRGQQVTRRVRERPP